MAWLMESSNEKSLKVGRWYLAQLANGCGLENAAFLDLQFQEDEGGTSLAAGLVVFQQTGDHPDLHEQDSEKRKTYERLVGKNDDRIMDSRIIFED